MPATVRSRVAKPTSLALPLVLPMAFILAAPVASAQDVEQVVVTGHLEEDLPLDLARIGVRTDVVSGEQIRNNLFLDVAQSLQTSTPGLYVSPKNGPFDYVDVSLLGSRTQDVLWLVDGVRINNRLYGGTTPLDALPASIVDRIVILEGSQALFYGTQGTSGAINIITKSFSDTPDGAFALGGDSNDGRHIDGYFRDTLAGNQFVVYASTDHSSGFQPFRDQDYQPSSTDRDRGYDLRTFGAKYAISPLDSLRLSAMAQHTEGRVDDAGPTDVAIEYNNRDEDILSGKLDFTPSEHAQLFVKGYFHRWRSHFTEFDNDLDNPGSVITIDDHDFWGFKDYGANAAAKFQFNPGVDYYVGADYQSYSGNDAVLVIDKQSEHVHAFFAEAATTPDLFSQATFAAGVRYNDPSVGDSATIWNASARFELPQDMFVQGLIGTGFRLPTAEELFANDPEDERGDPSLRPERSRSLNASFGGYVAERRIKWEIVGFYRNIRDLISLDGFDEVTGQDVFENIDGEVRVRGAEFVLDGSLSSDFSGTFSYTYSRSRQGGDLQIAKVPVQQGKLAVDYHPVGRRFGVSADINYVGQVFQVVGGNRQEFGKYAVFGLAGRLNPDAGGHHRITARLQNVFDKEYAASLGNARRDVDGSNYTYWNLGVPRTLELRYTYQY